jgi:hypothetical protein
MGQARDQLAGGRRDAARSAMAQAALALHRASRALAEVSGSPRTGFPGPPAGAPAVVAAGAAARDAPDLTALGLGPDKLGGKSWGELPGKLRTRIIQDMKDRYGEDYARSIKLYFEQIADTNKR